MTGCVSLIDPVVSPKCPTAFMPPNKIISLSLFASRNDGDDDDKFVTPSLVAVVVVVVLLMLLMLLLATESLAPLVALVLEELPTKPVEEVTIVEEANEESMVLV